MRVSRDGPSVWIEQQGCAGRRVPAQAVGRVVVIGRVRLDSDVVTLFTARDVPVVFVDRAGGEHAVALPSNHKLPAHYRRQARMAASKDAVAAFKRWAGEKRHVVEVGVLRRLFPQLKKQLRFGVGEGNYAYMIASALPEDKGLVVPVASVVGSLFAALVTERVVGAGLDCNTGVIHRRRNFGFVADLAHVLKAEADLQCVEFFRNAGGRALLRKEGQAWGITRAGMKDIAGRFERRRKRVADTVDGMIDEVLTLMREVKI
ncbi:MAG: CRISPR-associated endonuclease Cas1 [Thermodesulfovibrionales bacterium]